MNAREEKHLYQEINAFCKAIKDILDEPYDSHNSTSRSVSPDGVLNYNRLAKRFNSYFPKESLFIFREDTTPNLVTHPKTQEILYQLEYALEVINDDLSQKQKHITHQQAGDTETQERKALSPTKLFISHSTEDEAIASAFVRFMRGVGVREADIVCSSIPGTQIETGIPLFEFLRNTLNNDNVFTLFLLSKNFYNSPVSLNEMGAVWIRQLQCQYIILPGFTFEEVRGVIKEMNLVGLSLAPINEMTKARFFDFKSTIEKLFQMQISSNLWERERDFFLNTVEKSHPMGSHKIDMNAVEGFCIGQYEHDGCRIRKTSEERKVIGIIDFSQTTTDVSSICFGLFPRPDWRQFYQNGSFLSFSIYGRESNCEIEVEIKLKDTIKRHSILITENEQRYRIPLERFCAYEASWEEVREICFLFHRKTISKPLEVEIMDLCVE